MQKRLECEIKGRVQMVMFRDFVCRKAKRLVLTGNIQNMDNGTVYVIAEGEQGELLKLLEFLNKGSILSKVVEVKESWKEAKGDLSKFNILY